MGPAERSACATAGTAFTGALCAAGSGPLGTSPVLAGPPVSSPVTWNFTTSRSPTLSFCVDVRSMFRNRSESRNAIMNRATGSAFTGDPVASILGDRDKRRAAAQILGQAYVTAYALIASNREPVERIADTLIERKEMHGDEVVDLLNAAGLQRPEVDLMDDRTWPKV